MSDEPLTNAAVELMGFSVSFLDSLDGPPATTNALLADDFTHDDRRSGAINFGTIDASGWLEFVASIWDVGSEQRRFMVPEVVAVRDQRCAAVVFVLDYGNDMINHMIYCVRLGPDLRSLERLVAFDVDARDDAIALLDEWHAELGD